MYIVMLLHTCVSQNTEEEILRKRGILPLHQSLRNSGVFVERSYFELELYAYTNR